MRYRGLTAIEFLCYAAVLLSLLAVGIHLVKHWGGEESENSNDRAPRFVLLGQDEYETIKGETPGRVSNVWGGLVVVLDVKNHISVGDAEIGKFKTDPTAV